MLDSGTSYSFFTKSVVISHYWLVNNTEAMSIFLNTSSKVILGLMYTIPIVFCNIGGHDITQYVTY